MASYSLDTGKSKMIKYFKNQDENGTNWYEINGEFYGLTECQRVIDCDGLPLDRTSSPDNDAIIDTLASV